MLNRKAFTLIELMIVVGIIGVLASIAIPGFIDMQLRAKRAEVPANVDGIKMAEMAYDAAYDKLIEQTTFVPSSSINKQQQLWINGSNFDTLGWAPDGKVRGAYKLEVLNTTDFLITGICDVDGDGSNASYTAVRDTNVAAVTDVLVY